MKTKEEIRQYKREWSRKRYGRTNDSMLNSCTYKGRRAELLALDILKGSIDMNKDVMNNSFDILHNNERVDVKSCNLYKRKTNRGKKCYCSGWWVFNKNKGIADKYFCICLIDNIPVRYYFIPKECFSNGITIGQVSRKFDKYLVNKII